MEASGKVHVTFCPIKSMTFDEWYDPKTLRPLSAKERIRAAWDKATQIERQRCADIAQEHECDTWAECCDCRTKISKAILKIL